MICGCGQNCTGICPCETFVHPEVITNPPGRTALQYRVGDFLSFRHALLLSQPGEQELINWRPGAQGDLAVQFLEWWAYLADILTFYNERIANEDYLRTALLPESTRHLIQILGYRPRPGIGATATLGVSLTGTKPVTLPAAYPVQSKPAAGQQAQIFESGAQTILQPPGVISAKPAPDPSLLGSDGQSVLLQGIVTTVKAKDQLLLLARNWPASGAQYAPVVVAGIAPEKDSAGNTNTRVTFTAAPNLPGAEAADYRLVRSKQTARVWQYPADSVIQATQVDLESISRSIMIDDPVLFSLPSSSPTLQLVSINGYTEVVWYANPPGTDPTQAPGPGAIPIPIPHSRLLFTAVPLVGVSDTTAARQDSSLQFGWTDAGTIIPTPAATLSLPQVTLDSPIPAAQLPLQDAAVLISGADGSGTGAHASATARNPSLVNLSDFSDPSTTLTAPLRILFGLLPVSRGKTVTNEVLGSGNSGLAVSQEFALQNSPLTYLQSPNGLSGTDYRSTLKLWVDGVQWQEVPSFYNQAPDAQVFVTREDDQNITHVQFGDGINGSRLPTGEDNVVTTYRYGSGAESPAAGALTSIAQPWPGVQVILNPVAAGGGADPDPPAQIRRYAPQSVTTFGRAVSAEDYTSIAAQAPGVSRALAYFVWDAAQQRMMIKIYAGNDQNAVNSAAAAIAASSDPNRPVRVLLATAIPIVLTFSLLVDSHYRGDAVSAAVTNALTDPDQGLLGANVVRIGQSIWRSRIEKACLAVPGAAAVHDLQLTRQRLSFRPIFRRLLPPIVLPPAASALSSEYPGVRFDADEGSYFQLAPSDLTISWEVAQ